MLPRLFVGLLDRADEIFQLSVLLIGTFQFFALKHRRRGAVKRD
jgi:hypothetical protein